MMSIIRSGFYGIIASLVFIVVIGYLRLQGRAVEEGVLLDWRLSPVSVDDPAVPYLQVLGVFLWCLLGFWGILALRRVAGPVETRSFSLAALASLILSAGLAWSLAPLPVPSVLQIGSHFMSAVFYTGAKSGEILGVAAAIASLELLSEASSRNRGSERAGAAHQVGGD